MFFDMSPTATVTVAVGGVTKSLNVSQNILTSKGFVTAGLGTGYGQFYGSSGYSYNAAYLNLMRSLPGYTTINGNNNYSAGSFIATNVTYLHVCNGLANYKWANTIVWRNAVDGLLYINGGGDGIGNINTLNNMKAVVAGYGPFVDSNGRARVFNTTLSGNNKVYDFLVNYPSIPAGGPTYIGSGPTGWEGDEISTVATAWPATAAPIISGSSAGSNTAYMLIDPANQLIYLGEEQIFLSTAYSRTTFLNNLMYYITNASKYGSHFTDMFMETGQVNRYGHPAAPAPWDNHWNGATDNRGVTY
jgi:hypothetical protein